MYVCIHLRSSLDVMSVCTLFFSHYLSELSLSTDVMCARLFPWLSVLLGPEPPDMTIKTLVSSCKQITLTTMCLLLHIYLGFCRNQQLQRQMWGSHFFLGVEWLWTVYFLGLSSGVPHCKNVRKTESGLIFGVRKNTMYQNSLPYHNK